ncbi:Jojoba acyl CoA reductase-related male sterility protein [Perilla frutescens var. hirtella]|uniref:Fatty acyl-CoA reductase n=1 Tax=Perilla frutescens var. hirtella TaxID=608512 RepID=A0AAD4PF08_PERFH|nr:Jojoba acyl CoA reductase-related male sterility protein [Perilla frutescens var. hirtella]
MAMEVGSILEFMENKSILITGAAGFLAKIFIEKILRVQPDVKKLYLLLRAPDTKSAMLRFNNEIISKDLFKVLKEKHGEKLNSLISQKIRVVAGDITCDNLGVRDSLLLEEMFKEVDIVVNLAANTDFDERYDILLGINTLGAKHVLNFSKKCDKLKVLLHVSTAYVCGEKEGLILETPYKMGETLNGTIGLDIDAEKKLIDETLKSLKAENYSDDFIQSKMKELGIQRARKFGWPNTYVFTKAMGEMMLGHLNKDIPLVIIRPTIVTSTYKQPFPGWAEGVRTIDSLAVGYGKGRITCFLGDPNTIIDAIPADMVVNAMIVAMVAHANEANETIYHVGSSVSNPLKIAPLQDYGQRYFMKHPWINKEGRPVVVGNVKVLSSMESFHTYLSIHYLLPLKGLEMLNRACCQYFQGIYLDMCRKIKFVMRLVDLFGPYLFFKGCFDDMNTEKLRRAAATDKSVVETDTFYFDPKIINWEDYFMSIHIPGVVKYVFK